MNALRGLWILGLLVAVPAAAEELHFCGYAYGLEDGHVYATIGRAKEALPKMA